MVRHLTSNDLTILGVCNSIYIKDRITNVQAVLLMEAKYGRQLLSQPDSPPAQHASEDFRTQPPEILNPNLSRFLTPGEAVLSQVSFRSVCNWA